MKTTLQIDDHLIRRAKIRAAETNRRLRDVVEDGLRLLLEGPPQVPPALETREASAPYYINDLGIPTLRRAPEDKTVVTNEFLDRLRDELGEG